MTSLARLTLALWMGAVATVGTAQTPSPLPDSDPRIKWHLAQPHRVFRADQVMAPGLMWSSEMSAMDFLRASIRADEAAPYPLTRPPSWLNYTDTHWDASSQRYASDFLRPRRQITANGVEVAYFANVYAKVEGAAPGAICEWSLRRGQVHLTQRRLACDAQAGPFEVALQTRGAPASLRSKLEVLQTAPDGTQRTTSTTLHPRHWIVIGFGDSYASGEGNPDAPARWRGEAAPDRYETIWSRPARFLAEPAAWWDRRCRRSLLSWQALLALRLGVSERSQTAVSFVGLACSGDKVEDGWGLPRQVTTYQPSGDFEAGSRDLIGMADTAEATPRPTPSLRRSQLNHAIEALCLDDALDAQVVKLGGQGVGILRCRHPIEPDLVTLTIGGNDIGFAGIVTGFLLPDQGRNPVGGMIVRAALRPMAGVAHPRQVGRALETLPDAYADIADRIEEAWPSLRGEQRVVFARYPQVMPESSGPSKQVGCRAQNGTVEMASNRQCQTLHHYYALSQAINEAVPSPRRLGLTVEFRDSERGAAVAITRRLNAAAAEMCRDRWLCVDVDSAMQGSGLRMYSPADARNTDEDDLARREPTFLRDGTMTAKELNLPSWYRTRTLDQWHAVGDPLRVGRHVRTANDSFFAQTQVVDCKARPKASGLSPTCRIATEESLMGIAHPTAAHHAALADAVHDLVAPRLRGAANAVAP